MTSINFKYKSRLLTLISVYPNYGLTSVTVLHFAKLFLLAAKLACSAVLFCAAFWRMCTDGIAAALYHKAFAVYQRVGKLFARAVVYSLHRRARNVHLHRALLLRQAHVVDKPNGFVFIDSQQNLATPALRSKFLHQRHSANPPALTRPPHSPLSPHVAMSQL